MKRYFVYCGHKTHHTSRVYATSTSTLKACLSLPGTSAHTLSFGSMLCCRGTCGVHVRILPLQLDLPVTNSLFFPRKKSIPIFCHRFFCSSVASGTRHHHCRPRLSEKQSTFLPAQPHTPTLVRVLQQCWGLISFFLCDSVCLNCFFLKSHQ